jgi:hypothetical protein
LKKDEWKNCEIIKARCFLTILFASPLCFNKCGWQWQRGEHWSVGCYIIDHAFASQNGNLIEKNVSERTVKCSKQNGFSPFF